MCAMDRSFLGVRHADMDMDTEAIVKGRKEILVEWQCYFSNHFTLYSSILIRTESDGDNKQALRQPRKSEKKQGSSAYRGNRPSSIRQGFRESTAHSAQWTQERAEVAADKRNNQEAHTATPHHSMSRTQNAGSLRKRSPSNPHNWCNKRAPLLHPSSPARVRCFPLLLD